ncbi:G-protein alpha subunit-domain-containing protein, partial [Roridomyces roridus]
SWLPICRDSIIFLAPIWAFDQKLVDNPRINRLEDSFILWKDVVSSSVFERTNIILVLNKVDLMSVNSCENGVRFADYVISYGDRPNDFESTSTYLRKHFASIHKQYSPSPRPLYYYFTTAHGGHKFPLKISSHDLVSTGPRVGAAYNWEGYVRLTSWATVVNAAF